jgi:hypothetical protein
MSIDQAIEILKILVSVSILFVWVVRYSNIIEEFEHYGLPNWLRDFVGILKLSSAVMLHSETSIIVSTGALVIAILMGAAVLTHLRVKNSPSKMLPATSLLTICVIIFLYNY